MKLKPLGKVLIFVVFVGALVGGYRFFAGKGMLPDFFPGAKTQSSKVPIKVDLPVRPGSSTEANLKNLTMPGTTTANAGSGEIRWLLWAWNAQRGLLFANGGKQTTQESLMDKRDIFISFARQDDPSKMQEALVEFATELSRGNENPKSGATFVTIMGDGAPAFLAGVNETLGRLGPEYKAKIIGAAGFSQGEDKFMGPDSWRRNPASAMGGVVSGYLRDGDWNIAMKWLGDNGLKNNPDEKTYDPDALNWVSANDYIDAAEKYITGYTEERPVVRNGKRTGETKRIKVDAVVTWTPGDVNIAQRKGGLSSIVSTREYNTQMPCVIIGIDKWLRKNRDKVEKMLEAIHLGGDAVKASSDARQKAGEISAEVYGEQDAAYWMKYAEVQREQDATGQSVELGGSAVNNLADNAVLFGLAQGTTNIYAAVYRVFGDILVDQYPDVVAKYPPVNEILDLSYLTNVYRRGNVKESDITASSITPPTTTSGSAPRVSSTPISSTNYNITFDTGKATIRPESSPMLDKLIRELLVAGNTKIEIHGHTDNRGNPQTNQALSESRAFAVKSWLQKRASRLFPDNRVTVHAHGQSQPLVPNTSDANRARNRRVVIKVYAYQ